MYQYGQLPSATDVVLISVNPKAGAASSRHRAERLADLLSNRGLNVEILTDLGEVGEKAKKHHSEGTLRALVGVGGDGTAAELVNRTEPGVPITMLPGGTENLLSRHLRLKDTPEGVCETILAGRTMRLDAGSANGRVFLLMIGCGFDAEVVRRLAARRGGHIGYHSYVRPILASARHYRYPEMLIYSDDQDDYPGRMDCPQTARWFFGFNLPCYGGNLRFAPEADGSDGLLDACMFRRGSLWNGLRYLAAVKQERHCRLADCATGRARRLKITSSDEVPYQLDGDPGGVLPVEIEVLADRLTVIVPPIG